MILIHKKCKFDDCDNKSISIYGCNPFCRDHTVSLCSLKNEHNIFNEKRCNTTIEMIEYKGKVYCNSHFRTLISTCHHENCNIERNSNYLNFDKMWYCEKHKPSDSDFILNMIHAFQQKNIPVEIINTICNLHLKKQTYFI